MKPKEVRMNRHMLWLETENKSFMYEVHTKGYDAVGRARSHLSTLIGLGEATLAKARGCSLLGDDPEVSIPTITLVQELSAC